MADILDKTPVLNTNTEMPICKIMVNPEKLDACIDDILSRLSKLEAADVQHEKISKWCPPLMGQGKCDTYCERCHGKIMRNSTGIFEETPYCPHCGADMRGEQNERKV